MRVSAIAFLATIALQVSSASAQCRYSAEVIETTLQAASHLIINNNGDTAGVYEPGIDLLPFLRFQDGTITLLNLPPQFSSGFPRAINLSQVTGSMRTGALFNAVLWTPENALNLGFPPDANFSAAAGINSDDNIVGEWRDTVTGRVGAFLWSEGKLIDISLILTSENCSAADINNVGHIVGWRGDSILFTARAYMLDANEVIDIGVTPGGNSGTAVSINNRNEVIGWGFIAGDSTPFGDPQSFYWRNGRMVRIANPEGFCCCQVADLNNIGQAIGNCENTANSDVAFLWQGGQSYRLKNLVENSNSVAVYDVASINDNGEILGSGFKDNLGVSLILRPMNRPSEDIDCDCAVNVTDLFFLLAEWGNTNSHADITHDGIVDANDLVTLLSGWSQ